MTASHYDCYIKSQILNYTIESLIINNVDKCFVLMSFTPLQFYYIQSLVLGCDTKNSIFIYVSCT